MSERKPFVQHTIFKLVIHQNEWCCVNTDYPAILSSAVFEVSSVSPPQLTLITREFAHFSEGQTPDKHEDHDATNGPSRSIWEMYLNLNSLGLAR